MRLVPSRPVRKLLAGLTPIVLAVSALPLLAPTCGTFTPGVKNFSRNSLIIPMDVCYQCTLSGTTSSSAPPTSCGQTTYTTPTGTPYQGGIACPGATDPGDVVKAYGLVYQLIRNGVAVYWIIEPSKTKLDAEDFHVSYSGPPAFFYDWASGGVSATTVPATSASGTSTVSYRGGPFIIDGSDYALASQIMQQYKATFSTVNVHVSNVAFQAPVARTMAGGWSAGGAIPPKLALLDIGSSGAGTQNAEPVIRGYLIKAGLNFTGAGGTSAAGQHGQIYDRLAMEDFIPSTPGDWKTTRLYQNGYQILWVPHWLAPGSCSDCTTLTTLDSAGCPQVSCPCDQKYSSTTISTALKTIGAFYAQHTDISGSTKSGDVFAECAGLGSFEGVNTGTPPTVTGVNTSYGAGDATTHFQTVATGTPSTTGVWINKTVSNTATFQGGYASPFMQIGDFVFKPLTGAIQNYRPTTYNGEVTRFLSETNDTNYDIFTVVPASTGIHGTNVYLGGHSYSGCPAGQTYEIAGTRLVLNTLFNLGASCVASGVTCSTGELGVCARGAMTCSGETPVCERVTAPSAEICNGLDDDCNGLVDDLPVQSCYSGDPATRNVGTCREGVRSCVQLPDGSYGFSACQGEVLPVSELCNGLDDDCDGAADESLSQVCYLGPAESLDPITGLPMGECKTGVQSCSGGNWGACVGQVTPAAECCGTWDPATRTCTGDIGAAGNGIDENCNGETDEICGCTDGASQYCYAGPSGTAGVGPCLGGTQVCSGDSWGACTGQVLPVAEVCGNGIDDDCNGTTDDPLVCSVCPSPPQSCYEGPEGTLGVGVCAAGERTCSLGVFGTCGGVVGADVFTPQVLPSQEICDGRDNDCDGDVDGLGDEGPPPCASQLGVPYECVNGFCVPSYCSPAEPAELPGYTCDSLTSHYVVDDCGTTGAPCAPGTQCVVTTTTSECVDPCAGVVCGAGSICGGGQCTGGSCYTSGCPADQICKNGSCLADPCVGVYCPSGTFCREGDCVQACTFVSCLEGQRCGVDGFCEADACAGVSCATGKICANGACITNPCQNITCGTGQYCLDGACVDDPCAWIDCEVGVCYRGQCYSSANPTGAGTISTEEEPGSGGCGCATGSPTPVALLFGLLALPLARRRRREPRRGAGLLALALAAGLTGTLAGCPGAEEEAPAPIDLMTDAANCGQLGNACDEGEICVDGFCGPGSPVAPYILSIAPPSAPKGTATATVTVNGERFEGPAELRVIGPTPDSSSVLTNLMPSADGKTLAATFDISKAPTGTLYLRLVNVDNVRSNARAFDVILESPVVTAISPLAVEAGAITTLHVTGTGLNATSLCHVSGTNLADTALPTVVAAGGLDCTLDAATIPPGNYKIWVRNEGNLNSVQFDLVVTSSSSMTLTSISPSAGSPGTIISLTAFGTGFDSTCYVYFDAAKQVSTAYLDPSALFVSQLDLTPFTTGDHSVTVHCGTGVSASQTFTITAGAPSLDGVSPQSAYQGETDKAVNFTGSNLPNGIGLAAQIRKLDGTWVDFGSTLWVDDTTVTGTLSLTPAGSWPAGEYQVRLKFPDGSASASFPFRVLSNAATLYSISPAGAMQGANVATLTVAGGNFFGGITFHLRTSAGVEVTAIPVISFTQTTASIGPLDLSGFASGLYQIVAINDGSAASNALSFSVTPGPPTITTLAPASAVQSDTPVTVTITGTNFAKPDATGAGGSQVVGWNDGLGITSTSPIIIPTAAVEVTSATQILVTLDTRNLIPSVSPYSVQIWNPGGPTPPQKSNPASFTLNP